MTVIDEYLANVDEPQRAVLEHVREIIKKVAPDAEDTIGYGMPVLKYNGKYLIGFAPFKDHMSIFPGANPVESTKSKLGKFKLSKGTIQFAIDNPIPDAVLTEIVKECLKNISHRY